MLTGDVALPIPSVQRFADGSRGKGLPTLALKVNLEHMRTTEGRYSSSDAGATSELIAGKNFFLRPVAMP
jgi:hypothetical protein